MTKEEKEYIKKWLDLAKHDMIAAENLLEIKPVIYDVACFHCQQSVEKYLKGFLSFKNKHFEKTHDVVLLLSICLTLDNDFKDFDVSRLNDYAVRNRYPDDYLMPTLTQAKKVLAIAKEIENIVRSKIKFPK